MIILKGGLPPACGQENRDPKPITLPCRHVILARCEYGVFRLLESVFRACRLEVVLSDKLPGPDLLQEFIEGQCKNSADEQLRHSLIDWAGLCISVSDASIPGK